MIVVKLEVWPGGVEGKRQSIGQLRIGNTSGTREDNTADYDFALHNANERVAERGITVGRVINFDRTRGAWELVRLALEEIKKTRTEVYKPTAEARAQDGIRPGWYEPFHRYYFYEPLESVVQLRVDDRGGPFSQPVAIINGHLGNVFHEPCASVEEAMQKCEQEWTKIASAGLAPQLNGLLGSLCGPLSDVEMHSSDAKEESQADG